jgi:hypothetical protein
MDINIRQTVEREKDKKILKNKGGGSRHVICKVIKNEEK